MAQETSPTIRSVPAERIVIYPESDGEPMAETDIHRKLMTDFIEMLENHFRSRPDVYVSGNLLLYYEEGNPKASVAPDVFVVFGIERKQRRTYRLWEEGKGPDFVLELVSKNTYRNDLGDKKDLYASVLSVKEYYLYDPDGQYLPSPLLGYRLEEDGAYSPIQPVEVMSLRAQRSNLLPSFVLGLELGIRDDELKLYNPLTKEWVLKPVEQAEEKAQRESLTRRQAEARAQQAEARAQQESLTRRQAEARAQQAEARAQRESLTRRQAEARAQQAEAELARLRALLEQS